MFSAALTGTHGTGKTFIIEKTARLLKEGGYDVQVVPSMTRILKDLGYPINLDSLKDSWKTQAVCGTLRTYEEQVLRCKGGDVLLSDRWVLDEYIYALYFKEELERADLKDELPLKRLKGSIEVLRGFVEECQEEWDLVFWKSPHPNFLPEADGHREGDLKFQLGIQTAFSNYYRTREVKRLPLDRDEAFEVFFTEVVKGL